MDERYRSVRAGVETLAPRLQLPRHRHRAGYATVILSGAMVEASFAGRFHVRPGDVLLHGRFDCHGNWPMGRAAPTILRLPWFDDRLEGHFHVDDPDRLAQAAERDPHEAACLLEQQLRPVAGGDRDWPEQLADDLSASPSLSIRGWAARQGLAPSTVSRGFRAAFGVSPQRYRLESRARQAWRSVLDCETPLTPLAYDHGFADLAHLSRSIRDLTGLSPAQWRRGGPQLRSSWTIVAPVESRDMTAP
ncbi:MAG: helix-turn-helix domain-containing protein [Pseudomonadota bacterium]|jgi:AraC-like DNA-binding protein